MAFENEESCLPGPGDEVNRLAHEVIGAAIEVHRHLGPGLLESVYEAATKAFEAIQSEAKALSIPVLTRTQFVQFIGRPVPKDAKDTGGT